MAKDYAKYLIGYTISDDETRNKFREKLMEEFRGENSEGKPMLERINESMYKLRGMDLDTVEKRLGSITEDIKQMNFGGNDFIKLYYAAHLINQSVGKDKLDYIVEKTVSDPD